MECQRWPEKLLIWRRSGTQYVAMVTELLSSYCGAHLVESYCKESNISVTKWLRYLFSSYLDKISAIVQCKFLERNKMMIKKAALARLEDSFDEGAKRGRSFKSFYRRKGVMFLH